MPNLKQTKEALDYIIDSKRAKKQSEQTELQTAILANLAGEIVEGLKPVMAENTQAIVEVMGEAMQSTVDQIREIKIEAPNVSVNVPDVHVPEMRMPDIHVPKIDTPVIPQINIPEIKIPTIKVPKPEVTVNIPEIKIPKIEVPKVVMPDDIQATLKGVDKKNPLPVQMMDSDGKPMSFSTAIGGGGGGMSSEALSRLTVIAGEYATLLDDVSTTSVTYVGKAQIGTGQADTSWQIKKIDESGSPVSLAITWADGNSNFDNNWANRTSLTYI